MAPPAPAEGSCLQPPAQAPPLPRPAGPSAVRGAAMRGAALRGCSAFTSLQCCAPSVPAKQHGGTGTKLCFIPGRQRRSAPAECLLRQPHQGKRRAKRDSPPQTGGREGGQLNSRETGELFPPLQARSTEKYAAVYLSSWVNHPLLRGSPAVSLTGQIQCLGMRFERLLISLRGQTSQLRQCLPAPAPLSRCVSRTRRVKTSEVSPRRSSAIPFPSGSGGTQRQRTRLKRQSLTEQRAKKIFLRSVLASRASLNICLTDWRKGNFNE